MRKSIALCVSAAALIWSNSALAAPFNTGDIFAGIGGGTVAHYANNGTFIENLTAGSGSFQTGMAFDGSGNLYSTNFDSGTITRYDTNGAVLPPNPFNVPGSSPESISFAADGSFYVGRAASTVQHYAANGSLLQTYTMPQNTDWQDLAADQTTLFYNDEGGAIRRWNVATDTALPDFANNTANGGSNSFALRILANGDVLSAAGGIVTQYDALGAFLGSYDVSGVDSFFALNLDPDGTHFWSGSFSTNTLYEFTIGNFGSDVSDFSFATGGALFGVALAGELTVGGPPPNNGVPEPTTWAMMLLGFGAIGYQMRRTRRIKMSYRPA